MLVTRHYMKSLIILLVVAVVCGGCKRCVECSYTFGGQQYSSGSICGTKKEIEDARELWNDNAKVVGTTAVCVDEK
jgi:hypothetical protein